MSEDPGTYIPPSDLGKCQREIYHLRSELAQLRKNIIDRAALWENTAMRLQKKTDNTHNPMSEIDKKKHEEHIGYSHALEDCAYEIEELLNGDGGGEGHIPK